MRIWTGRASSGKTTAILREIAAACRKGKGRQVLLVPELHSHRMERRLAEATQNHGARTAEVLTFSRLDRKSTRLNSSHHTKSRMPSSA